MRAGLAGLDGFTVREDGPDGPVRRLEACQSPVWDTALAVVALLDAGVPADDPAMTRAARLAARRGDPRCTGDWAVRRPGLPPGGWAFEFANDGYPDTDDTAEVVLALRRVARSRARRGGAARRPRRRMAAGMQSRDGGWGAFDADNTRELWPTKLPFCDFGAVIDPPSADVTAHVVEMLAAEGSRRRRPCRRGVGWLLRAPGAGRLVVRPLGRQPRLRHRRGGARRWSRPGSPPATRRSARAVAVAATRTRTRDGGWGEDLRSYRRPGVGRPGRVHRVADRVGAARAARGRARRPAGRRARASAGSSRPSGRRRLGRAALHRHRLPRRLLHQLPPLPAGLPGDGARAATCGPVVTAGADGA